MRNIITTILLSLLAVAALVFGFVFSAPISELQLQTLKILGIVCGSAALYCFVVGEITRNNSQMDKLWSILPIAYTWIIAGMGNFQPRLVVFAVLVTLWGIRLTFNFARKGAYTWKFWSGEEDYRWVVLRQNKFLKNRFAWMLFDLFFISIYQNFIVLAMCLPSLASMESTVPFGLMDYIVTALVVIFLLVETVADEQQWKFQETKKKLLKEGRRLEELPAPYNRGFNTVGLWGRSRHPNYFGEQMIWVCLYLFVIAAGNVNYAIFSWTMCGPALIILLFVGSSAFGEGVSKSKYPEYELYLRTMPKYVPLWKYDPENIKE